MNRPRLLPAPSRSEELGASKSEAKQHAAAAELARQEKALLGDAQKRLTSELDAQTRSNVALQQTMQQMTEAHSGWRQAEQDATKRLQAEAENLVSAAAHSLPCRRRLPLLPASLCPLSCPLPCPFPRPCG